MKAGVDTVDIAAKNRNVRRGLKYFNATLLYRSESKKIAHLYQLLKRAQSLEAASLQLPTHGHATMNFHSCLPE
jgi:hypothetical protein